MRQRCYPPARGLSSARAVGAPERYERVDGPTGETALGDADAVVHNFAGAPDLIVLSARTFGALVTLTDRLNREQHAITVLPGQPVYVHASRDRVTARNLVAGSNAVLSVSGFWAAPAELGAGREKPG